MESLLQALAPTEHGVGAASTKLDDSAFRGQHGAFGTNFCTSRSYLALPGLPYKHKHLHKHLTYYVVFHTYSKYLTLPAVS